MVTFTYHHRVRYRECDPMGVVYHAHYIDYFEYSRTEALRAWGLPYRAIEDSGVQMPVVDIGIQYRRPAHYDDLLGITCTVDELPRSRIYIRYEVTRIEPYEETPLATGHVTLCFLDVKRKRPVAVPSAVREVFERVMNLEMT